MFQKIGNRSFIPASFNRIRNCSHVEKNKLFCPWCFFLFADDDVKTNDLELYFCKVFWYKCFCKKLYFGYCNLFIRKDLLERHLLERIKSLVGHLQFMVEQKPNPVEHLILPRVFPVGQNVRCVFRLVGQILILIGHCPMSDRYFKACLITLILLWWKMCHMFPCFREKPGSYQEYTNR